MTHANDWLQVSAGICAAIGFALLSIGLFGDSKDSGVKYIRPVLTGVGSAVFLLVVGNLFTVLADYMPFISGTSATNMARVLTTAEIFLGLLLGYGLGLVAQPLFERRPRARQLVRVYTGVSIVLLVVAALAISGILSLLPHLSVSDSRISQAMVAVIALASSVVLMVYSTFASPFSLKMLGFFVTLLGIYLAVLPSLLSILGASGQ